MVSQGGRAKLRNRAIRFGDGYHRGRILHLHESRWAPAATAYDHGNGVARSASEAINWYRKAALQGSMDGQYSLGYAYGFGKGVTQDFQEAAKWFRKAAEQGYAPAQYYLGGVYGTGRGFPQNDYEAAKWLQKAAEQGYAAAQFALANAYVTGRGVAQNDVQAYAWANLAASDGNESARELRDEIRERMVATQITEAQQLSAKLLERIESAESQ